MNIEKAIEDCEIYLKQMKQYDPDPFYVNHFFNEYINSVNNIFNEIFEEGNRDFGLFISEKISQKKFDEKAKMKSDQNAMKFSEWYSIKYNQEHENPYPNVIKKICQFKNKFEKLPKIKIPDQFHPIQVKDLGSLARLTYDPEFPDEQNLTLYALPHKSSWVVGYITPLEMDEVLYNFNYVELDSEPIKHFIKYQGNQGRDPEFSDSFDHGYSYLPIIKVKNEHSIFGF